jgi:hypothetical protein
MTPVCVDMREAEGSDAGSVDDDAAPGKGRAIALVEVCRPLPVILFTSPVERSAPGTSALTRVDLPTPGVADEYRRAIGQLIE